MIKSGYKYEGKQGVFYQNDAGNEKKGSSFDTTIEWIPSDDASISLAVSSLGAIALAIAAMAF